MSKVLKLASALPGDDAINGLDIFAKALADNPEGTTITAIVIFDTPGFHYSAKDDVEAVDGVVSGECAGELENFGHGRAPSN